MLLDDLVFRLEHYRSDSWELGDECFRFLKIKALADQYERFWALKSEFRPSNIFELGIWDGGSLAFWTEMFHQRKLVGVDIAAREDSAYFTRYKESRALADSIATYWSTDQADKDRLRTIVEFEFDGPLDLVIDDCSHFYEPTRASFEALYPLLRPGGLYVVEDWAWTHWPEFQAPTHGWASQSGLTPLVCDLVEAAGTSSEFISSLWIYGGFAVVERGPDPTIAQRDLNLDERISRRAWDAGRSLRRFDARRLAASMKSRLARH
jgi:SAM-dependent methyltransferase